MSASVVEATGWDPDDRDLSFQGYLVELEVRSENLPDDVRAAAP